jgi:FkbM family methyltransferase
MDTTKIYMHGFAINIRVAIGYQDVNVISDCLGGDCYGLEELAEKINPRLVLDIGGHIGAFGLCAKKYWPDCELIAIEPCKGSAELYRMNLKDNGLKGTVLNKGICYNPDRNKLVHASRTSGGYIVLSEKEKEDYLGSQYRKMEDIVEDVETITVEELLKDIEVVDLAKWDCEGAEIDAFRKMDKETAAKFRTMVGEYHLWADGRKVLQASPLEEMDFWTKAKRKFPHLRWSWTPYVASDEKYGKFQAWPK